jgi:hypothetical protein
LCVVVVVCCTGEFFSPPWCSFFEKHTHTPTHKSVVFLGILVARCDFIRRVSRYFFGFFSSCFFDGVGDRYVFFLLFSLFLRVREGDSRPLYGPCMVRLCYDSASSTFGRCRVLPCCIESGR